ncbi:MAG: hypothetical protein ACFFF4_17860, partial [Candidatus Thorarchaeota archaeon]
LISRDFILDINVILVLATGNEMKIQDVGLSNPTSARQFLSPLFGKAQELERFFTSLHSQTTRLDVTKLIALLTIERLRKNKTDGRLGIVFVDKDPVKFAIQKGGVSQDYIEFDDDMQNDEVFTSLLYSILDTGDLVEGDTKPNVIFRTIAELLEDFGPERPTLVIVCSALMGDPEDELSSYLQAIASNTNYRMDIIGTGEQFDIEQAKKVVKDLNSRIIHLEEFTTFEFLGYLQWALKSLSS